MSDLTREQIESIKTTAAGYEKEYPDAGVLRGWWRDVQTLCDLALCALSSRESKESAERYQTTEERLKDHGQVDHHLPALPAQEPSEMPEEPDYLEAKDFPKSAFVVGRAVYSALRSWASAEVKKLTGPGTLHGRLEWLAKYAEEHCGYSPMESVRGPEQAIVEKISRLETELRDLQNHHARLGVELFNAAAPDEGPPQALTEITGLVEQLREATFATRGKRALLFQKAADVIEQFIRQKTNDAAPAPKDEGETEAD